MGRLLGVLLGVGTPCRSAASSPQAKALDPLPANGIGAPVRSLKKLNYMHANNILAKKSFAKKSIVDYLVFYVLAGVTCGTSSAKR